MACPLDKHIRRLTGLVPKVGLAAGSGAMLSAGGRC
jgi:hypothetical protein